MVKTRSQALKHIVKTEEYEEELKLAQPLQVVKNENETGNSNNTSKRKTAKPNQDPLTEPIVKQEDTGERKLLKRPLIERLKDRWITREKLIKLIRYVEKDKMSVMEASRKVSMGACSALKYYALYKNDPEHKIPDLGHRRVGKRLYTTNQKIEAIIRCLVDDKMTVPETAKKTNTHPRTVARYYARYLNDPNRNIPIRNRGSSCTRKYYTNEQVEKLIGHIYNDNTTIAEAARRTQMNWTAAYKFYNMYKNDPEHKIPTPEQRKKKHSTSYTVEQVKTLIDHIVHDKMTTAEAAAKVKMNASSSRRYYSQYLRDPNHEIPVPGKPTLPLGKRCTQEQIKSLIGYIVNDGIPIAEASRRVHMGPDTGGIYYRIYLEDPEHKIPEPRKCPSRDTKCIPYEQIKSLISYIVDDKMTIREAAKKSNIERHTAGRYYRAYLKDPNREIPRPTENPTRLPTRDQIKQLFDYILNDKLTVLAAAEKVGIGRQTAYSYHGIYKKGPANMIKRGKNPNTYKKIKELIDYVDKDNMRLKDAAKKAKMRKESAIKYYNIYKNDPEHKIPTPIPIGYSAKNRMFEENLQVLAEIYEKNHGKIKTEE